MKKATYKNQTLLHMGKKCWGEYRDYFPPTPPATAPLTEVELRAEYDRFILTGHADILSLAPADEEEAAS